MRILHIINTLEIGGAQSVLNQLLKCWNNNNDQQMVISLRKQEQLSTQIEALGYPVQHIDLEPGEMNLGKFIRLLGVIKTFQPDIIQTWLYHSDLIGSLAARAVSRAPIVWGVHHTTTSKGSVRPSTWRVIKTLSHLGPFLPSKIICCSTSAYQAHMLLGYPEQKMQIIPNGINTGQFQPNNKAGILLRKELGLAQNTKLIGMFARYHPQKDFYNLLQAASIILKRRTDVHFILAGNGVDAQNERLNDQITQEQIHSHVHLLGVREDISLLAAGMDIFTLSSSFGEAMPQAVGEAMACGTPCVATNIGGIAELIGDTGIIVEPKNPQALAHAWKTMLELSDGDYAVLCDQARDRILKFFNKEEMVFEYRKVYQELQGK